MAKKRQRRRTVTAPQAGPSSPAQHVAIAARGRALPQWKWRTFPVFFAFVAGLLAASIVNPPSGNLGYAVQLIALAGFGYGLAHLFVTNVIIAGRLRRQRKAAERGELPPEAFEDELVYPEDETRSAR